MPITSDLFLRANRTLFIGLTLLATPALGVVDVMEYEQRSEEIAGTPEREEYEFKFAFAGEFHHSGAEIVKLFQERITELVTSGTFQTPKLLRRAYYTDPNFKAFAFKDIYLDTPDWLVYRNSSSYRLRYRWSRRALYGRYKFMPFVKAYYPTRCEIQFKYNYRANPADNTVQANESRFEFRNASEPFLFDEGAPPAPWPQEEYLRYAQTGIYADYKMLPSQLLFERLGKDAKNGKVDLRPAFEVVTSRFRSHLNIVDNPWGTGPNPDQAFILTVDVSEFEALGSRQGRGGKIVEIESEIDRNTYTLVDQMAKTATAPEASPVERAAATFSQQVRDALRADIGIIQKAITDVMAQQLGAQPLPVKYKYARMVESTRE